MKESSIVAECDSDALFWGYASAVMAVTPRYFLQNNIVAMVTPATVHTTYLSLTEFTKSDIYYFKDCNLSKGELIETVNLDSACYGAWKDTFYIVECIGENESAFELVIIQADGTHTRVAMQ